MHSANRIIKNLVQDKGLLWFGELNKRLLRHPQKSGTLQRSKYPILLLGGADISLFSRIGVIALQVRVCLDQLYPDLSWE